MKNSIFKKHFLQDFAGFGGVFDTSGGAVSKQTRKKLLLSPQLKDGQAIRGDVQKAMHTVIRESRHYD